MKKISQAILGALAFLLMPGLFALAQESEPAPESDQAGVVVADVNVYNAEVVSQNGREITLKFQLSNNGDTTQSQVKYAAQLSEKIGEKGEASFFSIVDDQVYDEVINLRPKESVEREVVYNAPPNFDGQYTVGLSVSNTKGLPLSVASIKEVSLTRDNNSASILQKTCFMYGEGSEEGVSTGLGIAIQPKESLEMRCDVENNSASAIEFVPAFSTFERTLFGKSVEEKKLATESLAGNEKKRITFAVPVVQKAQSYSAELSLLDNSGKTISNSMMAHYVVRGESGTIHDVQFDKDYYDAGESAVVKLNYSGRADLFMGAPHLEGVNPEDVEGQKLFATIVLSGSAGPCAESQKLSLGQEAKRGLVAKNISITNECVNPMMTVTLEDSNGKVLDKAAFGVKSRPRIASTNEKKGISIWGVLLFIIIAAALVLLIIFLVKRSKAEGSDDININNSGLKSLMLFFLVSSFLLFGKGNVAEALTFNVPPPPAWSALGWGLNVTASSNAPAYPRCAGTDVRITASGLLHTCSNGGACGKVWITSNMGTTQLLDGQGYPRAAGELYCHQNENCSRLYASWDQEVTDWSLGNRNVLLTGQYIAGTRCDYAIKPTNTGRVYFDVVSPVASCDAWSACSEPCGGGTQTRDCNDGCGIISRQTQPCNTQACPANSSSCGSATEVSTHTAPGANLCQRGARLASGPTLMDNNGDIWNKDNSGSGTWPGSWQWACRGADGTDTCQADFINAKPQSNAIPAMTNVNQGDIITINGTATDPDGDVVDAFVWYLNGGCTWNLGTYLLDFTSAPTRSGNNYSHALVFDRIPARPSFRGGQVEQDLPVGSHTVYLNVRDYYEWWQANNATSPGDCTQAGLMVYGNPSVNFISANPNPIFITENSQLGSKSSTLSWTSTNVVGNCTLTGNGLGVGVSVPSNGSRAVTPTSLGTHTYEISCSNGNPTSPTVVTDTIDVSVQCQGPTTRGACSKTCGGGVRGVENFIEQNGQCQYVQTDSESCNSQPCEPGWRESN